jgi:hypothetical protein
MAVAYLRSLVVVVAVLYAGDAREADATSASARAEFNVAADSSDDGPMARAWATINYAADVAEAGARVIISGGRYTPRAFPRHSGRPDTSQRECSAPSFARNCKILVWKVP